MLHPYGKLMNSNRTRSPGGAKGIFDLIHNHSRVFMNCMMKIIDESEPLFLHELSAMRGKYEMLGEGIAK